MSSRDKPSVFISFRTTGGHDESAYFEEKLSEKGINVLRLSERLDCPHPRETIEEWDWFSKRLTAAIRGIPHVVVIASEDSDSSQWIGWEIHSSFATARCLFICWISGEDPRSWITPLPAFTYWLFPMPSTFLIDGREILSADPVLRIAFPNRQTRVLSGAYIFLHLVFSVLVFYLVRKVLGAFHLPVDSYWYRVLAIATGALTLIVFFPRRAVFAYRAQRRKLRKINLVLSGQTGTRIVMLWGLLAAIITSIIISVFHLTPIRSHVPIICVIFLVIHRVFYYLYPKLIGIPLSRKNSKALFRGAIRTAERIDARRRARDVDANLDVKRPSDDNHGGVQA